MNFPPLFFQNSTVNGLKNECYGLIFLFKYNKDEYVKTTHGETLEYCPNELFYAKQVIENACATQVKLTTTNLWKLTVVLDYYEPIELTVVLDYYEAMETYNSRIGLLRTHGNL